MIISASRKTDIPAFYSEWFFNRLSDGYVCIPSSNKGKYKSISLLPNDVSGFVFWTKNPIPMINKLYLLDDFAYYFQFTINAYHVDIEPNVPNKDRYIIPAFKTLSNIIGKDRVIWRYDPILISDQYTVDYHIKYFEYLCKQLYQFTTKCIFSFLDVYKNVQKNISHTNIRPPNQSEQVELAFYFSQIAQKYELTLETCAESINLSEFSIHHAKCIDADLLSKISGCQMNWSKDFAQRKDCGCAQSVDIGKYNTCHNGCVYCYATSQFDTMYNHNPKSTFL